MEARGQSVPPGIDVPSVVLHKIDDSYFAVDGNHRVSVARYHGVEMIEAEVTLFRTRSSLERPETAAA